MSIGYNWGNVWTPTVWTDGVWAAAGAGVSPGRAWGQIWANGVWANGVWANEAPLSPTLVPNIVIGNFGWTAVGGTLVSALIDVNDTTYISTLELGHVIQFRFTQSPFATITGATLKLRVKTQ